MIQTNKNDILFAVSLLNKGHCRLRADTVRTYNHALSEQLFL